MHVEIGLIEMCREKDKVFGKSLDFQRKRAIFGSAFSKRWGCFSEKGVFLKWEMLIIMSPLLNQVQLLGHVLKVPVFLSATNFHVHHDHLS